MWSPHADRYPLLAPLCPLEGGSSPSLRPQSAITPSSPEAGCSSHSALGFLVTGTQPHMSHRLPSEPSAPAPSATTVRLGQHGAPLGSLPWASPMRLPCRSCAGSVACTTARALEDPRGKELQTQWFQGHGECPGTHRVWVVSVECSDVDTDPHLKSQALKGWG